MDHFTVDVRPRGARAVGCQITCSVSTWGNVAWPFYPRLRVRPCPTYALYEKSRVFSPLFTAFHDTFCQTREARAKVRNKIHAILVIRGLLLYSTYFTDAFIAHKFICRYGFTTVTRSRRLTHRHTVIPYVNTESYTVSQCCYWTAIYVLSVT